MYDVFVSYASQDADRVWLLVHALRGQGISVFWARDLETGLPNYQAAIKLALRSATVVVVAWTRASIASHPVAQECAQAEREEKLLQVRLDDLEPIDFPMEARFKAQKAELVGWTGDRRDTRWQGLLSDIIDRLEAAPPPAMEPENDLTLIYGVDETVNALLRQHGLVTFRQITELTFEEIDRLNEAIGIPGYVERHGWRFQADRLARGQETTYSATRRAATGAAED
jgi:ribosomal protein S13